MEKLIRFHSQGLQLVGSLHLPPEAQPPVVIGLHGLLSDRSSPKQIALAHSCTAAGMAYLRLDHRGCGQSDGDLNTDTTLQGRCRDLSAAVDWVHRHLGASAPLGLFGSSYGGTVVLAMAAKLKVQAVVTLAAPVESGALKGAALPPDAPAYLSDPGFRRRIRFNITPHLEEVHHLLLFHGDRDQVVPVSHAHTAYSAAQDPKRLCIQKSGDHRMSSLEHQSHFLDTALAWFTRYLKA